MRALVLASLAAASLALVPPAGAGQLPTRGIFVPGVSLAGIQLGVTQTRVKAALGANYTLCTKVNSPSLCKEPLWLYEYTRGEPLGVGVKFHNNKVTAVFTL